MLILVIPDVHLKPWIFRCCAKLVKQYSPDKTVCLMDIPDKWGTKFSVELYEQTYDAAIEFARSYPDSLWCLGNHDIKYICGSFDDYYSNMVAPVVTRKHRILQRTLLDVSQMAIIHKIDNTIFCHAGLSRKYVEDIIGSQSFDDVDLVIKKINDTNYGELWENENSPIWFRPLLDDSELFQSENMLQVVGHTPVNSIIQTGNLISTDVFTVRNREGIDNKGEVLLIDTITFQTKIIEI